MEYNSGMSRQSHTPIAPPDAAGRRLVLASGSPRRRDIVTKYLRHVELARPAGDEPRAGAGEAPGAYALRVARMKAREVGGRNPGALVIAADTIVVLDGDILGKPDNPSQATGMLKGLRGRRHDVHTAIAVLDTGTGGSGESVASTSVMMRRYSDEEIETYVATGDPLDKAGAYAIQDPVFQPAERIDGCYLNVVGLPLCLLVTLLKQTEIPDPLWPGARVPAECDGCMLEAVAR
ncbi:MAG: septum formation protein Maf [SAR202 cluster bacterium]|nr:septum formation protein Maf [SAR202 cluster bacterium]